MTMYGLFLLVLAVFLFVLLWPARHDRKFCGIIMVVFITASFGLYAWLGTPQIIPLLAERDEKLSRLKTTIVKDSDAVKADSKNLGAWVELGNSFIETSQYDAAANAFKQAVILSGGAPDLILAYAKSMILDNNGKVTDDAKKGLQMVILQEPDNAEARYFLILRQLQDGNTEHAMPAMKALYHSLPEDSPLRKMIDQQIGRAG